MNIGTNAKVETVEPSVFASLIAEEIAASIEECIDDHGSCSLVLSGGSTPSSVYRLLSRPPFSDDIPWDKVHLFIGDDKWIFGEDSKTNIRMISETLLNHRKSPEANVHCLDMSLPSAKDSAEAYSNDIKRYFNLKDGETPAFDIVLLGVGADGHIASVFPNSPLINDKTSIACAVENDGVESVTLTPHVLFNGKRILILVRGRDKADVVQQVLREREAAQKLPIMLYKEASDRVTWFLCSEAAQLLAGVL